MSPENDPFNNKRTTSRWPLRRGRKRLPTVRLGGRTPRRGFSLARLCRRVKLRWLKVKYLCILKKLKKYYDSFVRDMLEGSIAMESFHHRMALEASFAIPVMGLSFNPTTHAPNRPVYH
ncbi:hypothetical protein F511_28621 [Dorcoceras hygrometricum]|uniref:Uncharacterized protein n=1 Tax=Dorcoceras hygrometricum TaxID=472368 RepID=A0A2Z7BTF7_9LAMI|nr:hypothetical protein F511_28621 [Dorcoceras hygrometricum]